MGVPIETKYTHTQGYLKNNIYTQHYWFVLKVFWAPKPRALRSLPCPHSPSHFSLGNVSLPHESQCPLLMKGLCKVLKKLTK
jgi:hypothetical protein